jgi:hypothetical protein
MTLFESLRIAGLLALYAITLQACSGSDDRLTAALYFPLTPGSWWEYETSDGPIRVEVIGPVRRGEREWTAVAERLLDGHRGLADERIPRTDTVYYSVIDGDVHRLDMKRGAPVVIVPLGTIESDDLWLEEIDSDTVPAGIFTECLIVHRGPDPASSSTLSLAPGVGLIAAEDSAGATSRRLRAWRIEAKLPR